ncbi:MAG TPA: type III pantothenate kinase [Tepidisphaeraceae bacterium]|jgi:type III pantothenate kinase
MDINLLVLNVGNSRLAAGAFVAGELVESSRAAHADRGQWGEFIRKAWSRIRDMGLPAIAGASVRPELDAELGEIVLRETGQSIQWVGRQIDLPIEVCTRNPAETGIDRILNIAAAYQQMEKACVVVDAGTAITVDCCNDNGDFLGGAIAPGLDMMLDALHEKTAKVPRVSFVAPGVGFGDSTAAAVSLGVFHAIRGLVKETVESFATQLGSWPEIIVTGGNGKQLFEGWELIHAISPDLTLYGIALAYTDHRIRHDDGT